MGDEVKAMWPNSDGIFKIGPTKVNGKPYWLQEENNGSNAIWFVKSEAKKTGHFLCIITHEVVILAVK